MPFQQDDDVALRTAREHWDLPEPLEIVTTIKHGSNSDVWLISDGTGRRHILKYAHTPAPATYQANLLAAEHVEKITGIPTGSPLRTRDGRLVVMLAADAGRSLPLSVLSYVPGRMVGPTHDIDAEAAARLLARVHQALSSFTRPVPDVLKYLDNETIDIAHERLLRPAIRRVAAEIRALESVTWGICYGNLPEIIDRGDGTFGLVDWATVMHAPLVWDVDTWLDALPLEADRRRFVEVYAEYGLVAEPELREPEPILRLRSAQNVKLRAFRLLHSGHYQRTTDHDVEELHREALEIGVTIPCTDHAVCRGEPYERQR
ncbi:MAG TPA: phosphotransferase [Jatrophihabitans sp.]|nr:phosphotransferase [Jatrophihabitans sp.]